MPLNEEVGPTTVFGPTLTANNGLVHDFHQLHLALLNPNKMGCTFCNKLRRVLLMILLCLDCDIAFPSPTLAKVGDGAAHGA